MIDHGSLVISLDFEMMWGCHDWSTPDGYGASNVKQVREVIDRLLALFEEYGVRATFATVGLIMCKDKNDVLNYLPKLQPTYQDANCSPYKDTYIANIKREDASLYFAPDIIEKLKRAKGIEIGTHTFCHYFCWEKGQTPEQFREDLSSMKAVAGSNGIEVTSIVFPKNQVSPEYLNVCKEFGVNVYRGNALKFFNEPKSKFERIKNRICRLIDAYINIGGMTSIPYSKIDLSGDPVNLMASRMLRPFSSKLAILERLRLKRISREMRYAAKHHEMYHLWWHPHNFGANMEQNFKFLEGVLKCYMDCHDKFNMQSYSMKEMRDTIMN